MSSDDGIAWQGPRCPECGRELDAQIVDFNGQLLVAYYCAEHGGVTVVEPFGEA